jgi:hypothetical protein
MAKVVVIGVEGEEGLWVADLDAGTVSKMGKAAHGELAAAEKLRTAGATIVKGVDLAIAAKSGASVASGFMDG